MKSKSRRADARDTRRLSDEGRALAARVREARNQLGLNQREFAKLVRGVSQQKISDWESGKGLRAVVSAFRLLTVLSQVENPRARKA